MRPGIYSIFFSYIYDIESLRKISDYELEFFSASDCTICLLPNEQSPENLIHGSLWMDERKFRDHQWPYVQIDNG